MSESEYESERSESKSSGPPVFNETFRVLPPIQNVGRFADGF